MNIFTIIICIVTPILATIYFTKDKEYEEYGLTKYLICKIIITSIILIIIFSFIYNHMTNGFKSMQLY